MRQSILLSVSWPTVLLALLTASTAAGAPKAVPDRLPEFIVLKRIIQQHFADEPEYDSGDIISRSQVKSLLNRLALAGWRVGKEHGITNSVLPDTAYLVRQLRTSDGEKFMKRISSYPLGYDRLHQLGRIHKGRQLVYDLIHGVGGDEMVKYLTTSKGGKELAKQLTRVPRGTDFDKPTGQIYTEADLTKRLETAYSKDRKKRDAAKLGKASK